MKELEHDQGNWAGWSTANADRRKRDTDFIVGIHSKQPTTVLSRDILRFAAQSDRFHFSQFICGCRWCEVFSHELHAWRWTGFGHGDGARVLGTPSFPMKKFPAYCVSWLFLVVASSLATEPASPPPNAAYIDESGQTHVTRVVPVPTTVSPEAQAALAKLAPSILMSQSTVAEQRAKMDARQAKDAEACLKVFPAVVSTTTIAGVPVRIVTPPESGLNQGDRVLINIHGGGFRVDAGSLLESIPIAHLGRVKVVALLYRMAPENPFPAAVDDAVAVYRELLKTYPPAKIGIYGTSAGAVITAETAVRIKQLGLPQPAALGVFSAFGDFSQPGDSLSLFGLQGLAGSLLPHGTGPLSPEYAGRTDPKDPLLSPFYANLNGLPPTLFLTSTRDMLLSGTVLLHQAYLRAGVDARLVVFEALPHAFWLNAGLPESRSADEIIARFFDDHLGK